MAGQSDAFAVIRETIRSMDMVAVGRVVLTNREHIIALEPMEKGLMGTLLRYPYEVRKFEDHYETALIDLINKKRNGQAITPRARPAAGNVVNLMDALRASIGQEQGSKPTKKPKKAAGQKEMLLPIEARSPRRTRPPRRPDQKHSAGQPSPNVGS
jgi:DNA end-binding protein Ku